MAQRTMQAGNDDNSTTTNVRDQLLKASSLAEAEMAITNAIISKLSSLLMIPTEDIKPSKALNDYGLDSLVAVVSKTI
jgi:hypothetical protein